MINRHDVIDAFLDGGVKHSGNYISTGDELLLFTNRIAWWSMGNVYITPAGWRSITTTKALRHVIHGRSIRTLRRGCVENIKLGGNPIVTIRNDDKVYDIPIGCDAVINIDTGLIKDFQLDNNREEHIQTKVIE
jgi:hypothetical protein